MHVFLMMTSHLDLLENGYNTLKTIRDLLNEVEEALPRLSKGSENIPIIDICSFNDQEPRLVEPRQSIRGLKTLREAVKRDREVLDKVRELSSSSSNHGGHLNSMASSSSYPEIKVRHYRPLTHLTSLHSGTSF